MEPELTRVAGRMGQLVAENAGLDRQRRGARDDANEQRYRRNVVEILDCQIALQKARMAARPVRASRGLQLGLSNLYRNRAMAVRRMHTGAPRNTGWRRRAQHALATIGRS